MPRFGRIALLALACALLAAGAAAQTWTPVGPGIEYATMQAYSSNIFLTRMDRTSTGVIVDASLANGRITQPGVSYNVETIPSQVSRYNGASAFWGREQGRFRYKVIAAVNGNGFSTANGCPDSMQVIGGAMAKRTYGSTGAELGTMGFAYKMGSAAPTAGTPYMAGDVGLASDPNKNCLSFTDGSRLQFNKVNGQPVSNAITLYTHHYGARTPSASGVTEIVVRTQNAQPFRILPWTNYTSGSAVQVLQNSPGQTPIPFDAIVVVASGTAIANLIAKVPSVGTEVRFSQETTDYSGLDWTNMYCAIGPMWGVILRAGVKPSTTSPSYITDVHPRTAVAYNAQYLYFVVVDGRSANSAGITLSNLADFCVNSLAATDAVNNDGGGSSCMWVNGGIVNVPSDGSPRAVANGLMMIQLETKELSAAFTPGQLVTTNTPSATLNLRSGPGSQFHTILALTHGTPLTIQAHNLKGLRAQDVSGGPGYWWPVVTQAGVEGWVSEAYIGVPAAGVEAWGTY